MEQAGYSTIKQNGLAGGINTIGILGTIISAQIIDRLGRRACLMGGAAALFVVQLVVSVSALDSGANQLKHLQAGAVYEGSAHHPEKAAQYAPGAVTMLFLFNLAYVNNQLAVGVYIRC